jgi:2-oxo-4-hydroxy-4-carboxy-5-ureidoimidazoline decarboxylase
MVDHRPIASEASLLLFSDDVWRRLSESEWLEAFQSHPRIGESSAGAPTASESASWSTLEQSEVAAAADTVKAQLATANCIYEEKFGHIFIVCATGKSAAEILAILRLRMQNDGKTELHEAAEQQRQITQLRLKKWLGV